MKTVRLISESATYSSNVVARAARITLRQLQWWDEQDVVSPVVSGHRRVYKFEEAIEMAVIAELRRKGLSLQAVRRILSRMRRELGRRLNENAGAECDLFLATDGENVHLEQSKDALVSLIAAASNPVFVVSVTEQARRLADSEP